MNIIKNALFQSRQKAQANKEKAIRSEAEQLFQVREFNGKIYVCYRDIPIVENTSVEQLEQMRGVYIQYIKSTRK